MLALSVELAQTLVLQVLSQSNLISNKLKKKALYGAPFFCAVILYL